MTDQDKLHFANPLGCDTRPCTAATQNGVGHWMFCHHPDAYEPWSCFTAPRNWFIA